MSTEDCDCGHTRRISPEDSSSAAWVGGGPVQSARLPPAVAEAFGRFLSTEVATFGDVLAEIRTSVGSDGLAVEDLCHVDEPSAHRAQTASETYQFRCFFDGIVLSALTDEPLDVYTETPSGEQVTISMTPGATIAVDPPEAVMSFGVGTDQPIAEEVVPGPADAYAAICPYVKAFSDRAAFERWQATVPAATVGVPMDAAIAVAQALTDGTP